MKFFDTDWDCVFRWLAVWERLSVAARRHYLLVAQSHAATVSAEERAGRHVGTLFRITRRKTILAASQGTTAEAMLATLAKHSSKPVPANVAEEIRSWFAVCRVLTMRHSILIEAGDRETALRVQRLLGPRCAVLKDTCSNGVEQDLTPNSDGN